MRVLLFIIIGVCALVAHANPSTDQEAAQAVVQESQSEPAGNASDQAAQSAESPWQGTWTGSELDPTGSRVSVTARIKVTNGRISGTWRARGSGQRNITGQVNGDEATITILQGGSQIRATLTDENTFEYRGLRGFGTLSRQ